MRSIKVYKEKIKQRIRSHPTIKKMAMHLYGGIVFFTEIPRRIMVKVDQLLFLPKRIARQKESARHAYYSSLLQDEPDTFIIYRILGNDLPPRHRSGQTYDNVEFILKHEPGFDQVKKHWVLNRIIDSSELQRLEFLLRQYNQEYFIIPYHQEEYARTGFQFEGILDPGVIYREPDDQLSLIRRLTVDAYVMSNKNHYVMNSNGARNLALETGRRHAKWIMPWDGNCFLSRNAWQVIEAAIGRAPWNKYFIVPMARITDNALLLQENYQPDANEEPQIIFRKDASESFNELFPYGKFPKVELLKKLGVPGIWSKWMLRLHPWDQTWKVYSDERHQYESCGWVARLNSGNKKAESSLLERRMSRDKGIVECLKMVDLSVIREEFRHDRLAFYDDTRLNIFAEAASAGDKEAWKRPGELLMTAHAILSNTPYSVVHKTTLPPSGDAHDYWHVAPYSWPNPKTKSGLPYIFRDGERAPGTSLYEKESEKYDRTALQRMFDETTILSLAFFFSNDETYAKKAASLIRTWFIDPKTRMNPHLSYAQVQLGVNNNQGSCLGLIETKDFYFFLDAMRIIGHAGCWSKADDAAMRKWCQSFLDWLINSDQGRKERQVHNNHGLCYDLQVAAFAAYLGDLSLLHDVSKTASARLLVHIDRDGHQPRELKRKTAFHYCTFNLQSWINMAFLLEHTTGYDLWGFSANGRGSIEQALHWLLPFYKTEWPYRQTLAFDKERLVPLYHLSKNRYPSVREKFENTFPALTEAKPCYHPHDGIPVYWLLNAMAGG